MKKLRNKERDAANNKKWREEHKEYCATNAKLRRLENLEKFAAKQRNYLDNNPVQREKQRQASRIYRAANRDKLEAKRRTPEARARINQRFRERYHSNPQFKLRKLLGSRCRQAINAYGAGKKTESVVDLIGCTMNHLMNHLESQFKPGMSWDSGGSIHIDHIIPCSSFDLTDPEQQKRCFHYTNLQPLWAFDNQSKGNKVRNP